MGAQIAMLCALHGYNVRLQDISENKLLNAEQNLKQRLRRWVEKNKLTVEEVNLAFARLAYTTSLEEALFQTDFIIEAIVEDIIIKRSLFQKVDQLAPIHAIIATNSSTIVSSKLADVTQREDKVCNFHFFNPPLVMELVEVVKGPHTSEETAIRTVELAKSLGKIPILLKKEISGFVANRILGKLMEEALYLLEHKIATIEEIDLACTKALNHPIGPFGLIDLTGIDVHYKVRMQRYAETGDETLKPSKIITEMYERGELGRKTGKGFYKYKEGKRITDGAFHR